MPSNIILLGAVVIVIIAIGVVGILLIRRGRRAAEEALFAAEDDQHEAGSPSGGHFEPASIAPDDLDGELLGIGSLLTPSASRPTDAHVVTEPVLPHEATRGAEASVAPAAEASADEADWADLVPPPITAADSGADADGDTAPFDNLLPAGAGEADESPADEGQAEAGHQAPSSAGVLPPVEIPFAVDVAPRVLGAPTSASAPAPMLEPAPFWQAQEQPSAAAQPAAPAGAPRFTSGRPTLEQDYLYGVEQLLAEWRTKHDLALVRDSAPADAASEPGRVDQSCSDEPAASAAPDVTSRPSAVGAGGTVDAGQPAPPASATRPPHEEPVRPVRTGAAAYAAPPGSSSLPVFEAAEYEAAAADLHTHAVLLDPLGVVMLDMVDGTGKLTAPELKRLEVFRPDHIELAARNIQFPPRLQNDEDAVLRLAQIQLYAASLELRAKWSGQAGGQGDRSLELPYSPRDFKLKIARDIMALPASDRVEVIGYLLGGLLGTPGSSTGLKRAIIDTLEHLRSAQLANVLLDCLDDPDPIIQEYALAAADRLLDT